MLERTLERTLIKGNCYESIEYADASVTIRVTLDGGNNFAVATVNSDGTIEGDSEDLQTIVAECLNCSFDKVPDHIEDCTVQEIVVALARQDQAHADFVDQAVIEETYEEI